MQWGFAKGRDTYTGEEVGALYKLPGWNVTVNGRVGALEKTVSKHLLVTAKRGNETIKFLVLHLIRPIREEGIAKHEAQVQAIADWARTASEQAGTSVILIGDMNDTKKNMFGIGQEAGELNGYAPTHLSRKCFDHLVAVGKATWSDVNVVSPPYGSKPNKLNTSLWTDHFMLKGTLNLR